MKRYAIIGPESSGKTTLAQALADACDCMWVPEYAREFLLRRDGVYTKEDLDHIAKGQVTMWENLSEEELLICDTDMLVMKVWSEFKYGESSETIRTLADAQHFDHYFLCRPDIAWEEDPLREHPEQRDELFEWYLREVQERGLPFTIVEGELKERIEKCLGTIDN
jgi:NadR type nicotinamide-nucleotide adenylyltransferase